MSADGHSVHEGKGAHEVIDGHDVAKVAHLDGTVDYIDANAVGGDLDDMPKGYYYSPAFLGTMVVSFESRSDYNQHRRLLLFSISFFGVVSVPSRH